MKTLLFLGDSITDCNHYFDPENLGYGYVRSISAKLTQKNTPDNQYQVLNKGNDGFTVPALSRLWSRSCLNLKPDFITILIGINDLAVIKNTGITPSAALADFRSQSPQEVSAGLVDPALEITACLEVGLLFIDMKPCVMDNVLDILR